jgi:uncharacterized RDD family membrane protein YckC
MTRSSGGSGRQPNRRYRKPDGQADFVADDSYAENNGAGNSRSRPAHADADAEAEEVEIGAIDPKRRGIALMADVILAFGLSLLIVPVFVVLSNLIPHLTKLITQNTIIIAIMVVRDYFYQGHGFGKNLMGLQVVDASTGTPPTILQSIKRNILFFLPLIVMGILTLIKFLPLGGNINSFIFQVVNWICTAYVIVLLPAECWLAYMRPDGRRIGDKFANTMLVESPMDFSKPL